MFHNNKENLIKQIEKTRKQMVDLAKEKSLTDPELIKMSRKLDSLLNKLKCVTNKNEH